MSLHIDAEIVSAIFLLFLFFAIREKYSGGSHRERVFLLYIISTVATTAVDILARLVCDYQVSPLASIVAVTCYYMLLLMPVSCWLMYIMTFVFENNTQKYNRLIKNLHIPIIICLATLIINVWTNWFFTSNDKCEFVSGNFRYVLSSYYVIPGLASMAMTVKYKRVFESKKLFFVLFCLPFIVIIGLMIQLLEPRLVTIIPANSIIAFGLFMLVQNEETKKFTEQKNEEISKYKSASEIDGMTNLLNKATTNREIIESIKNNENKLCYLMIIDMDDLKTANDHYGHEFGDIALKQIAKILKEHFRSSDIVGRIGGDEFCVFVPDIPNTETMRKSTASLSNELHKSFSFNGENVPFHCSIGGAFGYAGEVDYETLFRKADLCLYKSKNSSKGSFNCGCVGKCTFND